MNITQPLHNMGNNPFAQTNLICSSKSSLKSGKEAETKLNFQAVMEQTKDKPFKKTLPTTSMTDYPIESYALPSWFGAYLPEKAILSSELNHNFWEFARKLSKDNIVADEEKNQLREYLSNDPFHKAELEKRTFRNEFEKEIGVYSNFLLSTFQNILKENDINSREDYYQSVILDKENSEKLRMEMDSRLKSNSQILELMDLLLS